MLVRSVGDKILLFLKKIVWFHSITNFFSFLQLNIKIEFS